MPGPKPIKLHDDLDALLDGRPIELTDELAPLAETAGAIRAELATYQLDAAVAEQHLERVLQRPATVVRMPMRQPNGWDLRRRVAAVVLAAALVLAPATMASAAALPGQAIYPLKLAIEQVRLVSVMWSPAGEAMERTRVADERLGELQRLVDLKRFNQVLPAIHALNRAVLAASRAIDEAAKAGAPVANVKSQLSEVKGKGNNAVVEVAQTVSTLKVPVITDSVRQDLQDAVKEAQGVLATPPQGSVETGTPTSSTAANQPPATGETGQADPPNQPSQPSASTPPASQPEPSQPPATPSPSVPETTGPPAGTPPSSVPDTTLPPGSGGESQPAGAGAAPAAPAEGRGPDESPPPSTAPVP